MTLSRGTSIRNIQESCAPWLVVGREKPAQGSGRPGSAWKRIGLIRDSNHRTDTRNLANGAELDQKAHIMPSGFSRRKKQPIQILAKRFLKARDLAHQIPDQRNQRSRNNWNGREMKGRKEILRPLAIICRESFPRFRRRIQLSIDLLRLCSAQRFVSFRYPWFRC